MPMFCTLYMDKSLILKYSGLCGENTEVNYNAGSVKQVVGQLYVLDADAGAHISQPMYGMQTVLSQIWDGSELHYQGYYLYHQPILSY